MKPLLFTIPLKSGMRSAYETFSSEITGPRKKEYDDLLKRYGLNTAKVWYQKLEDKEYVFVLHEADEGALDQLKTWSSSTHPFDLWFDEQLNQLYDGPPQLADLLFQN